MSSDVVRWTTVKNRNSVKKMAFTTWPGFSTASSLCRNLVVVLFIVINLNLIVLVQSDEWMNAEGARGHYTPTWAVHIDGGDEVAAKVAEEHGFTYLGKIIGDYYHFSHNKISKRSISPSDHHQKRLDDDHRVIWAQQQRAKSRQKRDLIQMRPLKDSVTLNDPKWNQMWYLNRGASYDMNVIPAWREGITGKGVVVTILDDGLETDHPDLIANYDKKASYDVNSHDEDPMPHYDMTDSNRHGTRCAGEVAATANNTICAVGIAFGARVGGVRMLDGDVTDAVEAKSLSLNPQHIDIYSASWGPDDDGKTVDGPGEMASRAFIEGVTKGRGGRGSIFIWASGNGGREHDNCNCDGYTNSIWTLSISSATEDGYVPWYSEMCSSTLATTYSSGNQGEKQIVTTDLHHSCTSSHTGTSASAPLAAGIVALVLEANKNLTWRDLQHIVVRTAKPMNLRDHNWSMNGVGRRVSHSFGYGLMDAVAMVRTARTWKTVPEQQRCEINAPHLDKTIPPKSQVTLQLAVQHCRGVNFLEHVQAKISLTSQRRGDIQIYLTSPAGTRVTLLTLRAHDVSRSGFAQWPFMSVHTWGEAPHGNWQLEIQNEGRFMGHAALKGWSLIFYGTTQPIDRNDPRSSTPHPPPSSFNNINYSISPPYKPQQSKNMNNNRKQNGQQQTYAMVTAPNKKNNEKKMKGNAGKNNNGKNGGNHRTTSTTTRPFQTTYYVSSSNRKYEYFSPPSHLRTTTLRPKQNPLFTNILGNRGGEKYQPYEKTPIKAPKQVKENVYTTATNHMETIDTMPTSNPNIQRMFQQYKKIQEIYPEFHPYTTTRVTNHSPSQKYSPPPFSVSQHQQQQISQYSGSSNGKPSRENSKFMFFPEPDFSGSSTSLLETQQQKKSGMMFTSSSGASSSVGGHDRGISSSGSAFISSSAQNQKIRKGNNAQITQWDLIFYGTEVSSQPDDPPRYVKSGLGESTYGSEMEHNSLEFGGETASGQWRDTHQVGESHVDIQRTTGNDQLPGSSCLHLSPDNKCLECVHGLYLYEGNCYESCPDRTYIAPESPSNTTTVKKIDRETAQLSLRSIKREIVQKLCYACHGSCFRCVGPFDFDCRECDADFIHTVVSPNEQYCIPKAKNIKIDSYLSTENLIYYVVVVLAAFGMISFFFCLLNLMKRILSSHMEKEYTYDQIKTRDESHNIKTYYSDSEVG